MITTDDIRESILRGRCKDTERLIRAALIEGLEPGVIVEEALIRGMADVGEQNRNAESVDIPLILAAARCVRNGMDILEPLMQNSGHQKIGTVILGTIEGDLHEVGKNLVGIMLNSVGLTVIDLGVDISGRKFLKAIKEHPEARIVSISSLLTTSLPEVKRLVATIRKHDKKHHLKIMVGGGAVTEEFAQEIGADVYTADAVEAAEEARKLILALKEEK